MLNDLKSVSHKVVRVIDLSIESSSIVPFEWTEIGGTIGLVVESLMRLKMIDRCPRFTILIGISPLSLRFYQCLNCENENNNRSLRTIVYYCIFVSNVLSGIKTKDILLFRLKKAEYWLLRFITFYEFICELLRLDYIRSLKPSIFGLEFFLYYKKQTIYSGDLF